MALQAGLDQPGRGQFRFGWSYPKFQDLQRLVTAYESIAGFTQSSFNVTGAGDPERVDGEIVTGAYFATLGVKAMLGRTFLPEEDRTQDTHAVITISEGLWKRKFGARSDIIGSTIRINQMPFTIVGVMPSGFTGESGRAEMWAPVMMAPSIGNNPKRLQARMAHWLTAFGRVRPGVSLEQAAADFASATERMEEAHPSSPGRNETWSGRAVPMMAAKSDPVLTRALWVLFGAVGFVLLIACINVATLLLSRAIVRRREMAIRLAIGASRGSLIRQLLAESILLSFAGGVAGLGFAGGTLKILALLNSHVGDLGNSPMIARLNLTSLTLDWTVLLFTAVVSLLTGILFGLMPALQASRPDPGSALKTAGVAEAERTPGAHAFSLRGALVTAQVALAVVLVAGAGLMVQSLARLLTTQMGFHEEDVLTFRVALPPQRYNESSLRRFHDDLLGRLRSLPGVQSAAVASTLPLSGQNENTTGKIDNIAEMGDVKVHTVSSDYFRTYAIPLIKGRLLTDADREGRQRVAVISERAARHYWPGQDPIGHRITIGLDGWGRPEEAAEIVGIVGDVKYRRLDTPADTDFYLSNHQRPFRQVFVALRVRPGLELSSAVIRDTVRGLDAALPVFALRSMTDIVADSASVTRFNSVLLSLFAVLALILATIGIFGMVSYSVTARTREMGVRSALGATARQLIGLALSGGIRAGVLGLVIGIPLALAGTRLLRGLLYEVKDGDPGTMFAVGALILVVTLIACYLPARRAAAIDPATALRNE
jgi:predicted permease